MKKIFKLWPPLRTGARAKRAIGIIALGAVLEYVDPLPFFKTPAAWALYAWLVFEIVKQFIHYRMETKYPAVRKAEQYKRRWEYHRNKMTPMQRYRIRRFIILSAGLLAYGQIINMFSERCDNPLSCGLLSINLIVEQAPTFLRIIMGIAFGMLQFAAMFWYLSGVGFGKVIPPGTIDTTFDDIYGQDKAKARIQEVAELIESDTEVVKAGGHLPKGGILTGPPGTGKTMMAKALANYISIPLILVPPGAFASTFIGINFLKVYRLGRWIRQQSTREGGVVVFIDEIDSLGNRGGVEEGEDRAPWWQQRSDECAAVPYPEYPVVVTNSGGGGNMGTLEAFLSMIDGMEEPRGFSNKVLAFFGFKPLPPPKTRVFYLGATNRPSAVDPALKRAGRLGLNIRVDYPRYDGRLATYRGYLSKVSHGLDDEQIEWIARNHFRGTGAEIEDVINEALLLTFRHNDREIPGVIQYEDLMTATLWKRWGESHGTFENDRNLWGVCIHEAGHALVMYKLLKERKHIWFVSVEQRGRTGGMVVPAPQDDDWKQWHDEMLADVAVSLASRVAEKQILGQLTNGHGGDGPAATAKAGQLVRLGHYDQIAFTQQEMIENDRFFEAREAVLQEALALAENILEEHEDALIALAELLQEKHTVIGTDVHELFDRYGV